MNAGKAVYGILSANSGVTDIVGTKIFPEIAEQETAVPFIVYQLQNVAPEDTHDGPSKLDEVQFEFLCYADSYNAAADLGVAVRAALDRVSGTYNGVNVESVQFNDVDVEIEYDPRRYSQVLKFTFRIKRDDITIALGTPVTGAQLGDLSDVDVDGVTNGQLIAYNSTSGNWEAADDAGGAESLDDLSDVTISFPNTGHVIVYDRDASPRGFVNQENSLANLTDTNITSTPNQSFLRYIDGAWTAVPVTIPSPTVDTNLAITDLTLSGNKTFDHDGGTLTFDLNDGGEFIITDSSDPAFGNSLEASSGGLSILGISYPDTDGTAGQAIVTDGNGLLSFADIAVDVQYHGRYDSEAETLLDGATDTVELYYTAQADGDGLHEDAQTDTAQSGYDIRRKLYYAEKAQANPNTSGDWTQFADIADDTTYASAKATLLAYLKERTGGTVPISLKMTWEEVAEVSPQILDTYPAKSAYSVARKLSSTYTGSAIRVRRASDNTEQDIGFSSDELDTTALATFCGSSDGFVVYFYDQTGNNFHQLNTSTSEQPKIYDGTTGVITENGKPAIDFDGSNHGLRRGQTPSIDTGLAVFSVVNADVNSGDCIYGQRSTGGLFQFFNNQFILKDTSTTHTLSMTNPTQTQQIRSAAYRSSDGFIEAYIDGASDANTTITYGTQQAHTLIGLGMTGNKSNRFNGRIQEVIYYETDQVSNQDAIHDNMNDFYSVY